MKLIDITGQTFGRLTVLGRGENHVFPSGQTRPTWRCLCDCGNEVTVLARNLTTGNTTSCGCFALECRTTHNKYGTKVYRAWDHMIQRCTNPNYHGYIYWGGRGIKVCDEWLNSFDAFYSYVSKLPNSDDPKRSLDRINNNGNYEPGNVRWATRAEQNANKRPRGTVKK